MRTVLLTAFEPFGGEEINASGVALERVDPGAFAPARLVTATLPCVFGEAIERLDALLREHSPELVLCLGQAHGRAEISLERVAINLDDARIPDNAGAQPIDEPVVDGGPAAYFSTLPIKAIAASLHQEGLPAMVSQTAGTFVCNHVFYGLMHALRNRAGARGGFVHVPCLPEQSRATGAPSLTAAECARGIEVAIATALAVQTDIAAVGGATH